MIVLTQVKCSVSNCAFYKEGNRCGADSIMIDVDKHARMDFNAEFAGESFDTEHQDDAKTSSTTCCHTFKPKE
ncbi:DUF1540 domain-containing protein [Paenibacillus sp.]|uniref:DUF1540 domain-containing protein n=1 Tax=Paenibacillus sp. TaxID=58172 RepID=UPI002811EBC7|nr:DUF1540 domain-containing protein [Paenibacillus sp.]